MHFIVGGGRRRLFLDSNKTSDAKYPLINGKHEFNDDSSVEITNGNHVKIIKNSSGFLIGIFQIYIKIQIALTLQITSIISMLI